MSSKPISFGFGKPKGQSNPAASSTKTSISLSLPTKPSVHKSAPIHKIKAPALHGDDDEDQDEAEPKHEELAGFSASGAILSKPIEQKKELVIENAGNQDWRRKAQQAQGRGTGKNLLPAEVQAQRRGEDAVMVEKDEVSTASGLRFAQAGNEKTANGSVRTAEAAGLKERPKTADEEALQALLGDDDKPGGTAIIEAQVDARGLAAPVDDFASLVATHPDSATLEDYAAMPVEEFGMAMLRGMGKKRRANGEVIQLESTEQKEVKKRKQEGFLGIGARPAKGMEGVELGAWGKSDMRKNHKGVGFFSPVMVRDRKTGETITEEEWERRKSARKDGGKEDDWRERRDRNLERAAKDGKNGDEDYEHKRIESLRGSRRIANEESDRESSRSRLHRSRSRSRETRRRDDGDGYDSRSSGGRRDRDRDRDRDRNRDRDRRGRGYDRDERRHRDR